MDGKTKNVATDWEDIGLARNNSGNRRSMNAPGNIGFRDSLKRPWIGKQSWECLFWIPVI